MQNTAKYWYGCDGKRMYANYVMWIECTRGGSREDVNSTEYNPHCTILVWNAWQHWSYSAVDRYLFAVSHRAPWLEIIQFPHAGSMSTNVSFFIPSFTLKRLFWSLSSSVLLSRSLILTRLLSLYLSFFSHQFCRFPMQLNQFRIDIQRRKHKMNSIRFGYGQTRPWNIKK